jgi:hypothetical protein
MGGCILGWGVFGPSGYLTTDSSMGTRSRLRFLVLHTHSQARFYMMIHTSSASPAEDDAEATAKRDTGHKGLMPGVTTQAYSQSARVGASSRPAAGRACHAEFHQ